MKTAGSHLDLPPPRVVTRRLLPLLELGQRVERLGLVALRALDDGRDELPEEAGHVQERRPEVVDEIDD